MRGSAAGEDCVVPICRDLRDPDGCAAVVDEALSTFGEVHAVVNNAGIGMATIRENFWADNVKFWDVPTDKWQAVFDLNVKAPFMLAKAAVPHMIAGGWGRIVNVTTSLDTMIRPSWTPYGPSKAALEASSANWAGDLEGTGVTVNVLIPGGPADTPFVPLASQPDRSRLVRPERMAAPILWLLFGCVGRRQRPPFRRQRLGSGHSGGRGCRRLPPRRSRGRVSAGRRPRSRYPGPGERVKESGRE